MQHHMMSVVLVLVVLVVVMFVIRRRGGVSFDTSSMIRLPCASGECADMLVASPTNRMNLMFLRLKVGDGMGNFVLDTGSHRIIIHNSECKKCKRLYGYTPSTQASDYGPRKKIKFVTQEDIARPVRDVVSFENLFSSMMELHIVVDTSGQSNQNVLGLSPRSVFLKALGVSSFTFQKDSVSLQLRGGGPRAVAAAPADGLSFKFQKGAQYYLVNDGTRTMMMDSGANVFVVQSLDAFSLFGLPCVPSAGGVDVSGVRVGALVRPNSSHMIVPVVALINKSILQSVTFNIQKSTIRVRLSKGSTKASIEL